MERYPLSGENIAYQLSQLDRIAGTFKALSGSLGLWIEITSPDRSLRFRRLSFRAVS
jgi:hypothetical protein